MHPGLGNEGDVFDSLHRSKDELSRAVRESFLQGDLCGLRCPMCNFNWMDHDLADASVGSISKGNFVFIEAAIH